MNKTTIENKSFDQERALYHLQHADIRNCVFAGPADGESVLKESSDVSLYGCSFSLRYPLWHASAFAVENTKMDELTRAPIWYAKTGTLRNCDITGVEAVRECSYIRLTDCRIDSTEFGWKYEGIKLLDTSITSEYLFFDSKHITLKNVHMTGKYSFQYVDGLTIEDSVLDTKDAFWHSKNVTVRNSVVKGEYLAWFSENVTFIDCKISGTQPFCYCGNLTLIRCTMEGCDLSFEYSDVNADVIGRIDSVKNPKSGVIMADEVGEIIMGDAVMPCLGEVKIRG